MNRPNTMTDSRLASTPVSELAGVGPATLERLQRVGLATLQDLLFHLPYRYQDRTRVQPIGALRAGNEAVIEGQVLASDVVFGKRRSLLCRIEDTTGLISMRLFHFNASQRNQLVRGAQIRCFGEVRRGASGLELYHPEYQVAGQRALPPLQQTLTPVYPVTEGLSQKRAQQLIGQSLQRLQDHAHSLPELLASDRQPFTNSLSIEVLLEFLHRPPANLSAQALQQLQNGVHPAQQKLAFEEMVAHHLSLLELRQQVQTQPAPALKDEQQLGQRLLASLPFQLTAAQQKVWREIAADLSQNYPMLRLVQGDVGSGKTVVAALAALQAVAQGYQAAIMAPTEILAEQHLKNFQTWLQPLGINIASLTGKQKAAVRREQQGLAASGEAAVVIGTHALFQKEVEFHKLALVIIDEQHRFGVHQRLSLREKGVSGKQVPHQLIMTATPIPRTLAMCAYADLDVSVIDELPPGRTPVQTLVVSDERRGDVISRVRSACAEGRQAYWVCTLIEESEALQCQAAEDTADLLSELLPELSIGLLHGRLKGPEKTQLMDAFKAGDIDLLVATTVIEVGVDVPNASLIIIENPERLGLAQLHQLRGRVGRGATESYCVLMYHPPLSQNGKARLGIMRETQDGFKIAEKDLELRGPGELLGTRQAGIVQFKVADLERDGHLLPAVRDHADHILQQYPDHVAPLLQRWLAHGQRFAQV